MIILNIHIDNFYNFNDFNMNLSYPKKITDSTIENEYLEGYPNFRYLKTVLLMGANATGKTCLGKAIKNFCDFINEGNSSFICKMVNNKSIPSSMSLEFVNGDNYLRKAEIILMDGKILVRIYKSLIGNTDSYETARNKLELFYNREYTSEVKEHTGKLNFKFAYPEIDTSLNTLSVKDEMFVKILKSVMSTLDPSIEDVIISKDLKKSFIIRRDDNEIIIQDGKLLNKEILSSGTIEGVDVSLFLAFIIGNKDSYFYYCDEHFSYIQSEVEKRIFQIMLKRLKPNSQLFFTTHNIDMADLNLPKHTFALLRRNEDNNPEVVFVSSLLKRNTDSVRCAIENDVFSALPDMNKLEYLNNLKYTEII